MAWYLVLLLSCVLCGVDAKNCRGEEPRERACENLCDENGNCKIRASLLLPRNTSYDASLSIVEPTIELALQQDAIRQAFPDWLRFEWMTYDVQDCDAAYAVISAIDAYNDCAHVFFGPSCDFALASVARIAKFLGSTGTPMLTTGGFSFDFVEPKQNCSHEFYMLVRAGPVGFKDLAFFLIDIMRQFEWSRVMILYDTPAYEFRIGSQGGYLLANNIHMFMTLEGIDVHGREMQSWQSYEDLLLQSVGNDFANGTVTAASVRELSNSPMTSSSMTARLRLPAGQWHDAAPNVYPSV